MGEDNLLYGSPKYILHLRLQNSYLPHVKCQLL